MKTHIIAILIFCSSTRLLAYELSPLSEGLRSHYFSNPIYFREGYLAGRIVNEQRPSIWGRIALNFFEAHVFLGGSGVPAGVADDRCIAAQVRNIREDISRRQQPGQPPIEPQLQTQEGRVAAAREACTEILNPWDISSYSVSWFDYLAQLPKIDLLIRINEYTVPIPRLNSNSLVQSIAAINPDYPIPTPFMDVSDSMGIQGTLKWGTKIVDGRVVVAVREGIIRDAWEIVVQIEGQGRVYQRLAVTDVNMFDYILRCMAAGKIVRIFSYPVMEIGAFISNLLHGYNTNLRIFRVEVLGQSPMQTYE